MSSAQKKSSATKKQSAKSADRTNGAGKTTERDAEAGRFVERANDHMERAWEKIYGHPGKAGSRK